MAISITQIPSEFNLATGPNVWVLSGLSTVAGADSYALQIEIEGNPIATFEQPANPSGVCIFDVQKVLQSYLSPEITAPSFEGSYPAFEVMIAGTNGNESYFGTSNDGTLILRYRVRYGSISNQVYSWTNYSSYRYVINGYKPFYDVYWLPSTLLYAPTLTNQPCEDNPGSMGVTTVDWRYLTDFPYRDETGALTGTNQRVALDEYATISWWNYLVNAADQDYNNFAPWVIEFDYKNEAGGQLDKTYAIISGTWDIGPRQDANDFGPFTFLSKDYIGQFGVGPQNLKDADTSGNYPVNLWSFYPNDVDHYYVRIWTFNTCKWTDDSSPVIDETDFTQIADYLLDPLYEMRYDVVSYDCQKFTPLRLSFMNALGTHDYYTFYKRNTEIDNITRNNYYQLPGSWSGISYQVYPHNRGSRTFSTQVVQSWTAQSDYMSEVEGEFLKSLFLSPHANMYWDGKWQSIELTNTTYEYQTFGRDKLFRYTITFNTAVNPRTQRG